jgi:hypothetical protein
MALPLHIDPVQFPRHVRPSRHQVGNRPTLAPVPAPASTPAPVARPLERRPVQIRIVAGGITDPRSRMTPVHPSRAVYRRRRILAVVVAVLAIGLLISLVSTVGRFGAAMLRTAPVAAASAPSDATPARPGMLHGQLLVKGGVYIAQPGDTLWVLARSLQPRGDLSGLVHRLETLNHGPVVRVGQRLHLPS